MTARDAILTDIGAALGASQSGAEAIAAEARGLLAEPDSARPSLPLAETVESFIARVAGPKVVATVDRIAAFEALPSAVARYLAAKTAGTRIALQPIVPLAALDWAGAGLQLDNAIDDRVVVGVARWGIAETGSVVFHSAADTPILTNFLGAVHIVAIPAGAILPHLEDYAAAARAAGDPAPRNACLITGPSGTTDIEGSLVRGAHGPRDLHIVVIG
jgi:L-lactate dehydrogenase complex protein LldG